MAEESNAFVPSVYKPPSVLPIAQHRDALLYTIETYPVTILVGETGSGKTTQLPQFLYHAGWCADGKVIAVTQPRRVAATSVSARVAEEMRCSVGQEVGYSIRFEDATTANTRIKFLTDGMLIREALVDPLLRRYSVIMVDEAHERSLSTDLLLALLKKIRKKRPELRLVVSSATIQAEDFLRFFTGVQSITNGKGAGKPKNQKQSKKQKQSEKRKKSGKQNNIEEQKPSEKHKQPEKQKEPENQIGRIVAIEGRMYPVNPHYLKKPTEDYLVKAVEIIFEIHKKEAEGDILVFLTGREDIEKALDLISEKGVRAIIALPLYAGLPTDQQMRIFDPTPDEYRKVILSTNIAEASITINGIVYVIDCGFVKQRAYNPATGIETLTAIPVSKASARQRAGRAGRTKAGKCYRLYTKASFKKLPDSTIPEIQRSNFAPTVLNLKSLGVDNIVRFEFLTPPPAELVSRALEQLYMLGALDDNAKLTRPLGTRMAELSIEPMMAKVLLEASNFGVLSDMLSIAAMTSLQGNVWFSHEGEKKRSDMARRKFAVEEGDHLTLLNAYLAFVTVGKEAKFCHEHYLNYKSMQRAVSVRNQLKRYMERFGIKIDESLSASDGTLRAGGPDRAERVRRCLTTGYFEHAAKMQPDGSFKTVNGGTTLWAHPSSLMFNRKADWVVFHEVMETGNKTFIRDVTKIERSWLLEYGKLFYQTPPS